MHSTIRGPPYLSSDLNRHLPANFFAELNVQFDIEIDVATFEERNGTAVREVSALESAWTPPPAALTLPMALVTPIVEITVFNSAEGPILAGAIELVSPANKDRPEKRNAFISKCQAYLQQGVGLVVVDVVTERRISLHNELMTALGGAQETFMAAPLYAVAYRPLKREEEGQLALWWETLEIGRALPTLPLFVRGGPCLPVDLEGTYQRTCEEMRVPVDGPAAASKP
jgi:hypothetical protein